MTKLLHNNQIKEFKDVLIANGGASADFKLIADSESVCFAACSGEYQFIIRMSGGRFVSEIIPKPQDSFQTAFDNIKKLLNNERMPYDFGNGLDSIKDAFGKWVQFVVSEILYEGIWDKYPTMSLYSVNTNVNLSEKFTNDEQEILRSEIENFSSELATREDLKEALDQINIKLEVLGELVSELSKVDWRDHAIGAMMGLSLDGITSSDSVKDIAEQLVSFISEPISKILG